MIIRKKLDAMQFLEKFTDIASYDYENEKHYFVFKDKERGGQYTLMKKDERWSIHGKGENYCDDGETMMDDIDGLLVFIWKHRSKINHALKEILNSSVIA
ncbi:hypothetical protein M670_01498 [Schinkia azotoformans MEV2011]|uniref:Uncharacterized protein n=1 Tax=Schinkia azotoformans MEV2011 TaxID=1348973 RepID=A0A072NN95_SCHAZ|nr:hypothetical protein [Schinkia azotoformans]KEF39109.1 hypothetical protein M670_01498 [Schinkia azotoformans MEV2011]MEC1696508.1 hypothetical protein [Schinkia azotoformans]MEC1718247.1 hypothetical protein [Schinkia azotoformans]MEC1726348.1 hypothetical protein [Schinkia azotoformans]MEC1740286.1 hypothetical protein [Schinkia azotoformans]